MIFQDFMMVYVMVQVQIKTYCEISEKYILYGAAILFSKHAGPNKATQMKNIFPVQNLDNSTLHLGHPLIPQKTGPQRITSSLTNSSQYLMGTKLIDSLIAGQRWTAQLLASSPPVDSAIQAEAMGALRACSNNILSHLNLQGAEQIRQSKYCNRLPTKNVLHHPGHWSIQNKILQISSMLSRQESVMVFTPRDNNTVAHHLVRKLSDFMVATLFSPASIEDVENLPARSM